MFLYVEVTDKNVVYTAPGRIAVDDKSRFADQIGLISVSPPYLEETLVFGAEAPGPIITYVRTAYGFAPDPTIAAHWQDGPRGYQLEARIPASKLGTHLGLVVSNSGRLSRLSLDRTGGTHGPPGHSAPGQMAGRSRFCSPLLRAERRFRQPEVAPFPRTHLRCPRQNRETVRRLLDGYGVK